MLSMNTSVTKNEYQIVFGGRRENRRESLGAVTDSKTQFLLSFRKNLFTYFVGCGKGFRGESICLHTDEMLKLMSVAGCWLALLFYYKKVLGLDP